MGIDRGPDGVGWQVRRIEDAAAANSAAVDQERTQFVVRLDREEWGLWRAHVRQQDCLMKVRVALRLAIVLVSMTITDGTQTTLSGPDVEWIALRGVSNGQDRGNEVGRDRDAAPSRQHTAKGRAAGLGVRSPSATVS